MYATAFAIGGRSSASLARLSARQHSPHAAWAGRAQRAAVPVGRGMPLCSETTGSSDARPAPSGDKWDGKELGTTSEVTPDGLVILTARDEAQMTAGTGDVIEFDGGNKGFVLCSRPPVYFIQTFESEAGDLPTEATAARLPTNADGDAVVEQLQVAVGPEKLGRVVDYMDRPLDGMGPLDAASKRLPVFNEQPEPGSTESITRDLHTGLTAVDSLTPVGRGQSMLVIGPKPSIKRSLAVDTIHAQATGETGVKCVYACLSGQADEIVAALDERPGAREQTIVVAAPADASPAIKLTTAAAAAAAAEGFRNEGQDALLILDDVDTLSQFWDLTSRTLLNIYGSERVDMGGDSEMRAFYSSLLQRTGQLTEDYGSGSVSMMVLVNDKPVVNEDTVGEVVSDTASDESYTLDDFSNVVYYSNKTRTRIELLVKKGIPVTDDVCEKLGIPAPKSDADARAAMLTTMHVDQLISLADGHILLSPDLVKEGQDPPLDPAHSLTRIGVGTANKKGIATTAAMRTVASRLRLELAAVQDLKFSSNATAAAGPLRRARAWKSALYQTSGAPRPLGEQVLILQCVSEGLLDEAVETLWTADGGKGAVAAQPLLKELVDHVRTSAPGVMEEVTTSKQLSVASAGTLKEAAESFLATASK